MENKDHPLTSMLSETMDKIRGMVDANTVIGNPIVTSEVTLIPISRVGMGFASGGSDFSQKNQKPEDGISFGGGSGAGISIVPMAFLVVRGEDVRLLPIVPPNDALDRAVSMAPELIEKITTFLDQRNKRKEGPQA